MNGTNRLILKNEIVFGLWNLDRKPCANMSAVSMANVKKNPVPFCAIETNNFNLSFVMEMF